jgi:HK97 family phage prohead protease
MEPFTRTLAKSLAPASETDRTITAVLSDERVALDNHVIKTDGIDTSEYNGTVLFAHDDASPPIARMLSTWKRGTQLMGTMQFADPETYPFADTVYKLIRGKYLNSMSISWFPLKYERANDRSRPDGLNFLSCRLLEASVVPVPANSGAIIEARSAGIDLSPLNNWARKASTNGKTATAREIGRNFSRVLSRRNGGAIRTISFQDLRLEAEDQAAKIIARVMIYNWPQDEIEAASGASCAELVERGIAGGLSRNEIRQIEAIFQSKVTRHVDSRL